MASRGAAAKPPVAKDETPLDYSIVRILYATDRAKAVNGGALELDEQLRLGTCDVTIPRDHGMGALESAGERTPAE